MCVCVGVCEMAGGELYGCYVMSSGGLRIHLVSFCYVLMCMIIKPEL